MKKHGSASQTGRTAVYNAWVNMKQRCLNPKHPSYPDYGQRGIAVCDRWIESFSAFASDMGPKPAGASLERRENDKGYSPDNCYWATREQQQSNRRANVLLMLDGRTQTLKRWAKELGISHITLRARIVDLGWPIEKALTTPADKKMDGSAGRARAKEARSIDEVLT